MTTIDAVMVSLFALVFIALALAVKKPRSKNNYGRVVLEGHMMEWLSDRRRQFPEMFDENGNFKNPPPPATPPQSPARD
jgi:hypothetical protein